MVLYPYPKTNAAMRLVTMLGLAAVAFLAVGVQLGGVGGVGRVGAGWGGVVSKSVAFRFFNCSFLSNMESILGPRGIVGVLLAAHSGQPLCLTRSQRSLRVVDA